MRILNIELNRWVSVEIKNLGVVKILIKLEKGQYVFYFDAPKAISIRREEYVNDPELL